MFISDTDINRSIKGKASPEGAKAGIAANYRAQIAQIRIMKFYLRLSIGRLLAIQPKHQLS